jgi:Co/Zn/Cd efflux system component
VQQALKKTTFIISKMDCPSEEQLIRMKLSDLPQIQSLDFDIPKRKLTVYHSGAHEKIHLQLNDLKLDTAFYESIDVNETVHAAESVHKERTLLWQVLAINAFFFALELITGYISNSMGLVADSLDMLADSIVYGMALWAAGGSVMRKKKIALFAGYFQLLLAILGFTEVVRRFMGSEAPPNYLMMVFVSVFALMANALCLYLLQKSKSKEAHIQASMIFTSGDVFVNLGVMAAALMVYLTQSPYPDIIIGSIVFVIVGRGAIQILKLAR